MIDCKVSTCFHFVSVWDDHLSSPYILSVHAVTIVMSHYSTVAQTIQCTELQWMVGRGMERGEINEKGHWLSS